MLIIGLFVIVASIGEASNPGPPAPSVTTWPNATRWTACGQGATDRAPHPFDDPEGSEVETDIGESGYLGMPGLEEDDTWSEPPSECALHERLTGLDVDDDMVEEAAEFLAATSFGGAMRGYVFKLAERGMGYYRDRCWTSSSNVTGWDGGAATPPRRLCLDELLPPAVMGTAAEEAAVEVNAQAGGVDHRGGAPTHPTGHMRGTAGPDVTQGEAVTRAVSLVATAAAQAESVGAHADDDEARSQRPDRGRRCRGTRGRGSRRSTRLFSFADECDLADPSHRQTGAWAIDTINANAWPRASEVLRQSAADMALVQETKRRGNFTACGGAPGR